VEPPPSTHVLDVWVAGPDQVFVVTFDADFEKCGVWHYDGTSWHQLRACTPRSQPGSIWGQSPTNIFVGAYPNSVLHFDGTSWQDTQAGDFPFDFWGTENGVFAVGARSTIKRYDGERWHTMVRDARDRFQPFLGIWGSSPANIFAVGDAGMVRHYDGSTWRTMWFGTESSFAAVWGIGETVFVIGTQSYMGRPR
jgi:hypothetical protein